MKEKQNRIKLTYLLVAMLAVCLLTVGGVTLAKYVIELNDVGSFTLDVVPSGTLPEAKDFKTRIANFVSAADTSGTVTKIVFGRWSTVNGYTYGDTVIAANEWENGKNVDDYGAVKAFVRTNTGDNTTATTYILSEEDITAPSHSEYLFAGYGNRDNSSQGYGTFRKIEEIIFENFYLPTEFYADNIFNSCTALETLDLSSWANFNETTKTIYLRGAFKNCSALTSLSLDGINFTRHSDIVNDNTFTGLSNVEFVSLKNTTWWYGNIEFIWNMKTVKTIDLTGINTERVTKLESLFNGWDKLHTIEGLEDLDVDNLDDMTNTFVNCKVLNDIHFQELAAVLAAGNKVTKFANTFQNCEKMTVTSAQAIIKALNTGKVTSLSGTFSGCTGIEGALDLSQFDTSSLTNMNSMFKNCSGITKINLSNINFSKITFNSNDSVDTNPFSGCTGVTELNLSNTIWNSIVKLRSFNVMTNITKIDFTDIDTSTLTSMKSLFYGMTKLKTVTNLSHLDIANVKNMSNMFHDCRVLSDTSLKEFAALLATGNKVESMGQTFYWCFNMTTDTFHQIIDALANHRLEGAGKITNLYATFHTCKGLTNMIDLSKLDMSQVTDFSYTFKACSGITEFILPMSLVKVTTLQGLFEDCSALTTIYAEPTLQIPSGAIGIGMFSDCSNLVGGKRTTFAEAGVTNATYARIDGGTDAPGYFTDIADKPAETPDPEGFAA